MKKFFLSLKTTVWTLFILVCLFFVGSYMMPAHREIFSPMNEGILLDWTREIAIADPWHTWWFFAALVALVLLTANTLVCSLQAVRGKWSRSEFFLRVSPQIIHAGFLLILLAHLLSAVSGYKLSGMLPEGAVARLPGGLALGLQKVDVQTDPQGFMTDWNAEVSIYKKGEIVQRGVLAPNKPVFYQGIAIYLKSLSFETGPAAVLLVAEDPGAPWALAGGILFILGSSVLLLLKWKQA
jgi:cytochrome c biogenesis protein ResB